MPRIGEGEEAKVLRIIRGLRKSKTATSQSEIAKRAKLDSKTVRQVLRRLRRQKKVEVSLQNGVGKKKIRVYT